MTYLSRAIGYCVICSTGEHERTISVPMEHSGDLGWHVLEGTRDNSSPTSGCYSSHVVVGSEQEVGVVLVVECSIHTPISRQTRVFAVRTFWVAPAYALTPGQVYLVTL